MERKREERKSFVENMAEKYGELCESDPHVGINICTNNNVFTAFLFTFVHIVSVNVILMK